MKKIESAHQKFREKTVLDSLRLDTLAHSGELIALNPLRARSRILMLCWIGLLRGSKEVAPGAGSANKVPCTGTKLWITMPAKSALSSTKSTCANKNY